MTRVAIVRDSDLPVRTTDDMVRAPDETVRATDVGQLRGKVVAAGHEVTAVETCAVLVVALTPGGRGLADRSVPVDLPVVAVIARTSDAIARGFDEADRSSIETWADAYVLHAGPVVDAIAWVASEARAERTRGQPRLTVVGTSRDDFGMSRSLATEPMVIGRASDFSQHPQRPDRMPTPTGSIARVHAQARCIDGVVSIRDARSTNGTVVIRRGERARLLCPQQATSGREFGPPETAWLIRDSAADYVEVQIGDQVQLPGFWRFRVDGDRGWRPED